MLTTGPNLGLLDNGNYGEGTYHELLRLFRGLDALVQPHVKRADLATPPGSPVEGDCYIIPANPTGAWAGQTGKIARWTARHSAGNPVGTPSWEFFTPKKGWLVGVDDTGAHLKHNGTTWYDYTDDAAAATQEDAAEAAASAAAALVSESNAADSETAAAASAAAALVSENNAADSETAAAASQTAAASSQTASAASASAAAASATSAGNSATTATTQATTATTQATTATTKASEASASASAAATSATAAAGSATTATTQAGVATTKANEAASSAAALAASLEAFRTQSLGTFASDPTVDGNGDPLQEGAEYFNSVTDTLRIYVNGQWQDYDYSAQQSTAAASLSASNAAASAGTATAQANIATTQAGNAASSASAASTSAGTASAQAAIATTQAETATTKAGEAAASQSAAATSATNASNSASTATTQATNASNSASAAATSATAAAGSATTATTQAGTATSQASSAAGSATAAAASATTATNQAAAAAGSALSAASVVSQDLSAIDRTVFAATIVDVFLYDTEKDSDGGAWRHRCGHTSWEAETLSGNWLGSAANETAARAISGAATGSYYYDTTALGFYTLNAGSGKTATYRGNVRQFPAQVLITVEAERVVIWDLTQAGAPMWMVFDTTYGASPHMLVAPAGYPAKSAVALNGNVALGAPTYGMTWVNFVADTGYHINATAMYKYKSNVAARNTETGHSQVSTAVIVNATVNDVAMTVLPNAPVDVATGLPVPTIAVATNGGVSVIKDDGTVVDLTYTVISNNQSSLVMFPRSGGIVWGSRVVGSSSVYLQMLKEIPSADYSSAPDKFYGDIGQTAIATFPFFGGSGVGVGKVAAGKNNIAIGNASALSVLHENPATPGSGMVAAVTKDYNSGWMVGDIRGAWLADTVAETVTGTELVTNGTFTTDTTGWVASNISGSLATLSAVSGRLRITNNAATGRGAGYQTITTVVGKTYCVAFSGWIGTSPATSVQIRVGTAPGDFTNGTKTIGDGVSDAVTFIATATTTYLTFDNLFDTAGIYIEVDNVSCRLADVDRSVKAKGLQIFGSLTKAAVASGAALMGYSGFSAANYLEQPYNSNLDFGTGDFCIMGWVNINSAATTVILNRALPGGTGGIQLSNLAGGALRLHGAASSVWSEMLTTTAGVIPVNTWTFIVTCRDGSTVYCYVNGVRISSAANTTNLSYMGAVFHVGGNLTLDNAANGPLALWRAGATAPSAEQIKHIYETEKALFEANAQCCLAGTSNAVTALAYDEETDLLHVGTSYGRSAFKGLVRVSSEATPVGAITALAASAGVVVQGGASGADVYVPAYNLREELLRDAEQMARFGQNLIAHDFTATASQTTFTLPVGWEIVAVYQQGAIKRETTSWTRSFDGFKWSAVLGTGATVSDWISILAKRV